MSSLSCIITKVIRTLSSSEFALVSIHNFDEDTCEPLSIFLVLPEKGKSMAY